ncbi:MAG: pyridoxal phosphate-dependent aminotransferase [Acidobacteriota bacterium]
MIPFSSRTPREIVINRFSQLIERKRFEGAELLNLTESNPTRAGFDYPQKDLLAALAQPASLRYEPDPKGLMRARMAVVDYYAERAITVEGERIVLTASTSEAYTWLFKLLAEPGDSVLVPVPSYPLFDHLAHVECVKPIPYPLYFDGAWQIDFAALRAACRPDTRAIILVNPNNPTGSFLKRYELAQLIDICHQENLVLICDEVFADYAYDQDNERVSSLTSVNEILTFTLNGLSKIAALPQLKLGWIVVNGHTAIAEEACARLEFIADLFLSVATPVQHALSALLASAPMLQDQLRIRVADNRAWLAAELVPQSGCQLLPAEGGWYAIVRVPRIMSEEEMVLELLEYDNVLTHPGYFFDFPSEAWLILSMITPTEIFREGTSRLLRRIHQWLK